MMELHYFVFLLWEYVIVLRLMNYSCFTSYFLFYSTSLTLHPSFLSLCHPIFSFSVSHPPFLPVSVSYITQVCWTTWASWQPQGSISHSGYDGPRLCPHCQDFTLLHGICPGWEVSLILVWEIFFSKGFSSSVQLTNAKVIWYFVFIWSTPTHTTSILPLPMSYSHTQKFRYLKSKI